MDCVSFGQDSHDAKQEISVALLEVQEAMVDEEPWEGDLPLQGQLLPHLLEQGGTRPPLRA